MAIVINGSGTLTGLAVGGLPDGIVDTDTLANTTVTASKVAADVATQAEIDAKLNLAGGTMTGNLNVVYSGQALIKTDGVNPYSTGIKIRNNYSSVQSDWNLGASGGTSGWGAANGNFIIRDDTTNSTGIEIERGAGGSTGALYIDSSDNVGIGTTPKTTSSTYTNLQVGGTGTVLGYKTQVSGSDFILGNNVYYNSGFKRMYNEQASMVEQLSGKINLKVSAAAAADSAITWTTGFEVLNDGKARAKNGLLFGSDTAAANALDDYEEGTWTPVYTVTGGGSHSSVSAGNAGTYTKVGRIVTISIYSYIVQTSGTITGYNVSLPFAAGNYPSSGMGIEFGHTGHGQKLQVNHNASTMNITKYDGSSPMGSAYFHIGITYHAA